MKKENVPELQTFTLLNPDFVLPLEEESEEKMVEKESLHGNISEFSQNEGS